MQTHNHVFGLLACIFLPGCVSENSKSSCRSNITLPEPKEVYLFTYDSTVDITELYCGHIQQDKWGDRLKRFVRKNTTELTREREKELGNIFHDEYLPVTIVKHPKTRILNEMVAKMKTHLRVSPFDHRVFVIQSNDPNAFTISGGNIYVTTGLLDAMPIEDEIAYVIGHEIGHTENNHTREAARYFNLAMEIQEKGEQSDASLGSMLNLLGGVAALRAGVVVSRYLDQSDELEADATGLWLAYQVGYDPEKAIGAAKKLAEWEGPPPKGWLARTIAELGRSHPWATERKQCLQGIIQNSKKVVECGTKFLKGTEGVITTQSSPLTIREYPSYNSKIIGYAQKGETVSLGCACTQQDIVAGRKGRWIYIATDSCIAGWTWGHFIQLNSSSKN